MKLIQLNVERDRHVDRWVPFLAAEKPDVVCLEEVMEPTLARVASELGLHATYEPMALLEGFEPGTEGVAWGIAILTRTSHTHLHTHYYRTDMEWDEPPVFHRDLWRGRYYSAPMRRVLLVAEYAAMRVGVTHFTWTPDGCSNIQQVHDLVALHRELDAYDDMVLCGDFNIPRATNELYHDLHSGLTDNVPLEVESTLDETLHRKPELRHVVDYVSTTSHYAANHVRVVGGLSDHKAIIAEIERVC